MKSTRYAANTVTLNNGMQVLRNASVLIVDGVVSQWRELDGEEPFTQWIGGNIDLIEQHDHTLRAYKNGRMLV